VKTGGREDAQKKILYPFSHFIHELKKKRWLRKKI
jgi:hypothetical protein